MTEDRRRKEVGSGKWEVGSWMLDVCLIMTIAASCSPEVKKGFSLHSYIRLV